MNQILYGIILLSIQILYATCFVPSKIHEKLITSIEPAQEKRLDVISQTLTHEDIIKKGLIKSVVKYFHDIDRNATNSINMTKIGNEYESVDAIYEDFYGKKFCFVNLAHLIEEEFEQTVGMIDFDPKTKNLAEAHFDSEALMESNTRVMRLSTKIIDLIHDKEYKLARELTGKVLHTIHDFYSHSNWVEMGNLKINKHIGTSHFEKEHIIVLEDKDACISNCQEEVVSCDSFYQYLSDVIDSTDYKSKIMQCPFKYYKCKENIEIKDKLLTGYFDKQRLKNGNLIEKPRVSMKCSHGGLFDSSSSMPAYGGINKDSGYYLFSPHAHLHLLAANLAINHTEYYFNEIRKRVGDKTFSEFLQLDPRNEFLNRVCNFFGIYSGSDSAFKQTMSFKILLILNIFSFFYFIY